MSPTLSYVEIQSLSGDSQRHLIESLVQKMFRRLSSLDEIPFVELSCSSEEDSLYAISLICKESLGVQVFFYEIITKWLIPGRRVLSPFFLHCSFKHSLDSNGVYCFCEIRFSLTDDQDFDDLYYHFQQLLPDLKQGVSSAYQAHKILEHRSFYSSDKHSLIQERILSLIKTRPDTFDYDLFGQMQHFFLSSQEDFKLEREHLHLSRLVYVFYLFRKVLKQAVETVPGKRHVCFKTSNVRLHRSYGLEKVLGVFVGINFIEKNELFDEQHLEKALSRFIEGVSVVDGSLFPYLHKQERLQILYLELEKPGGEPFSKEDILKLRSKFPQALETQVEKLMPALFMPRNEEEVMKNVIRLSQELKYIRDLPQVFISFDEQTDSQLVFTVVLLRVLLGRENSIAELFKQNSTICHFVEDRVKLVGFIRGKYPKEATVFRVKLGKDSFMRRDHTVDLLGARQFVAKLLEEIVGEFRDYNGGMISKQVENLRAFKIGMQDSFHELELERFFHTIYPVEMRAVIAPDLLKALYETWHEAMGMSDSPLSFLKKIEPLGLVYVIEYADEVLADSLSEGIKSLHLSSSQWVGFSSKRGYRHFQGYILLDSAKDKAYQLDRHIKNLQDLSKFSAGDLSC